MSPAKTSQATDGPRIGAHVSTAGHIDVALDHAKELGAEAMQIFGAAPQMWRRKTHPEPDIAAFREKAAAQGVGPNFIHGVYLTNLATADPEHLQKGIDSLTADMRLASALGVAGVIFHVGSHKGMGFDHSLPQIAKAMRQVLDDSPDDVWLCIENNAGTGDSVCSSFDEIGRVMEAIGSDRVKVCFDTCHAFSAGYDLTEIEGFELAMTEFDKEIGTANLVAVHANDSKTALGSGRDRHENIGWGTIGVDGMRHVIAHPAFRNATWMLEVPGFEGGGPDQLNLKILRALRDGKRMPRIPKAPPPEERKSARGKSAKKSSAKAAAKAKPAKAKKPATKAKKKGVKRSTSQKGSRTRKG